MPLQLSPPDEIPPTTQSSTRTQSPHASSQASLSSQLAVALNLLHKKSEEISELQALVDALREQPTNSKVNLGAKRAPFSAEGIDHVATGSQTDQIIEAQAAVDLERSQWAEQKSALQCEIDALRADKAQALIDVEFFRAQYQRASAFTSSTRSENEELLARATLAESQAVNGIAMIRATFEARVGKLESEVGKYKALSEMLTERARRTDDGLRYRAAIAPELEREYHRLQTQLDEREGELDEMKDELRAEKKVNFRLRRLVARLETEGQTNGRKSHDGEPPPRSSDERDDEDYVPGASPSSSPPNENGSGSSPRSQQVHGSIDPEDVTIPVDQDVERLAGDDGASRTNDDMVYLCWWRSGEGGCDAVVASKSVSHLLH
jgi:chromosome segregation ATPase